MRIFKRYYFTIARKFVQNNNLNHIYKYMSYIQQQKNFIFNFPSDNIEKYSYL